MIIGTTELPDPQAYDFDDVVGTSEETLLSGDRRYLKLGNLKRNIRLFFLGIDEGTKDNIETLAINTGIMNMTLDGKTYTVVSYSNPRFTRMRGSNKLYQCDWELRES